MTLIQLEYIVAVDTYRSFVLAAEKCFVTQPTLSVQIQKLEQYLGVKLFDRTQQPVAPTEAGKQIILQARVVLAEAARIGEIVKDQRNELSGELRIGVIPTIAPYLLPGIIKGFSEKYPKVQLLIWEYTTDVILKEVKKGLLDCGILSTPLEDKSLEEIPLFYEDFVIYASDSNTLLSKKSVKTEDLSIEDIWLLNEGHCMRNQVINICRQRAAAGNTHSLEYNTGSVETLRRMVDINKGVTILPQLSTVDFTEEQLERVRHFAAPVPSREISLLTLPDFVKKSMIKALEKEIRKSVPPGMLKKSRKDLMPAY